MALPTQAELKAQIKAALEKGIPGPPSSEQTALLNLQSAELASVFLNTIKAAQVTVPGTGLIGYSATPITGISTSGSLS